MIRNQLFLRTGCDSERSWRLLVVIEVDVQFPKFPCATYVFDGSLGLACGDAQFVCWHRMLAALRPWSGEKTGQIRVVTLRFWISFLGTLLGQNRWKTSIGAALFAKMRWSSNMFLRTRTARQRAQRAIRMRIATVPLRQSHSDRFCMVARISSDVLSSILWI